MIDTVTTSKKQPTGLSNPSPAHRAKYWIWAVAAAP